VSEVGQKKKKDLEGSKRSGGGGLWGWEEVRLKGETRGRKKKTLLSETEFRERRTEDAKKKKGNKKPVNYEGHHARGTRTPGVSKKKKKKGTLGVGVKREETTNATGNRQGGGVVGGLGLGRRKHEDLASAQCSEIG